VGQGDRVTNRQADRHHSLPKRLLGALAAIDAFSNEQQLARSNPPLKLRFGKVGQGLRRGNDSVLADRQLVKGGRSMGLRNFILHHHSLCHQNV
jgi:hypothetical protein